MNAPARIVINPDICHGRPTIAGTRMRVVDILDGLAAGDSVEKLLADFPYITREDILACIAYGARGRSCGGASRLMRFLGDAFIGNAAGFASHACGAKPAM